MRLLTYLLTYWLNHGSHNPSQDSPRRVATRTFFPGGRHQASHLHALLQLRQGEISRYVVRTDDE